MVFAPENLLLSFLSAVYHRSGWYRSPPYPRQSFFRFPDKENRKYCLCSSSVSPVPPQKNFCRHIIVADHAGMFIRIKYLKCTPDLCSRCQSQCFRYFFSAGSIRISSISIRALYPLLSIRSGKWIAWSNRHAISRKCGLTKVPLP